MVIDSIVNTLQPSNDCYKWYRYYGLVYHTAFYVYIYRCRFSQILKPVFEEASKVIKNEFPVSSRDILLHFMAFYTIHLRGGSSPLYFSLSLLLTN